MSETTDRIDTLCERDHDGALRMVMVLAYITDGDIVVWDDTPTDAAAEVDYDAALVSEFMGLVHKLHREELTELALSMSLCPIHLVDYAICFDDEDTECRQVRRIHPGHDT